MSGTKSPNIATGVRMLVEPAIAASGLLLWDVRFVKEGASWFLKVVIDKEGGVSIDDCESVSKQISKLLDEADPIEQSYYLEVSSPGIERELLTDAHFQYGQGKPVTVRLIRPAGGIRDFTGILKDKQKDEITITLENSSEFKFKQAEAAYVRLQDEMNTKGYDDNE